MMNFDKDDRRGHERYPATGFKESSWQPKNTSLISQLFGKRNEAAILDLSASGLKIFSKESASINDNITVAVNYRHYRSIHIDCRVRSTERLPDNPQYPGEYWVLRLNIEHGRPDQRKEYARLIERFKNRHG
jgi:hypothetical protein